MTALTAVAFAPFLLKDDYLLRSSLTYDLARHLRVLDQRRANLYLTVTADKQDIRQGYFLADCPSELFNFDEVSLGDTVLFTPGSNNGVLHEHSFPEAIFLNEKPAKVNKALSFLQS
jgi:hypothetical protein